MSDPIIKDPWYVTKILDLESKLKIAEEELNAAMETLEMKQKIISVMHHDLLNLGVNFDFHKALDRHAQIPVMKVSEEIIRLTSELNEAKSEIESLKYELREAPLNFDIS